MLLKIDIRVKYIYIFCKKITEKKEKHGFPL